MYGGNTAPKLIDNSKITFTSSAASATVNSAGVVTAASAGTATIEAVVKTKTSLIAKATVTVTA